MYKERKDEVMKNTGRKIKLMILMFFVFIFASLSTIEVYAIGSYTINGVTVKYTDFSSSPDECWVYANNIYKKIWGTNFTYAFSSNDNMLRNLSDGELTLTVDHLKSYISNASLGSCLRICNSEYLHGSDGWGHSQIIVQKDANGFAVLEGGLSASPYCREKYYTWSEYCNTGWLGGTYQYIKYIKWPGAPAYSQLTEKPMNVVLALEKTTFFSNEHVTYYCAGDNVDYYVISIYDDRGNVIETVKVLPGEYCTRYYEPGNYMAYCEGYNLCGNTFSNTIKFVVKTLEKPTNVVLTLEKTTFFLNEHVTYYCAGDNVDYYVISIYDDRGNVIETVKVLPGEYCTRYYEPGNYMAYCEGYNSCGNTFSNTLKFIVKSSTETIPHIHDYISTIKKPATCIKPGIMLFTCKDNDDSYEEEIPPTGHQHTELRNVKAATCAQEGYTGDTYCKDCNTKLATGKSIAKKDHTWDSGKITTVAICSGKGIKTYTCTGCNATRTEEIPSTGHQHTELRNVKAATCAQEGYTGDTYCKDCNTKLTAGKVLPKTDHTWDSGKITTVATCSGKGIKTYTCTGCNATRTEEIPSTGHQHTELRNVKAATCAQEGYTGDTYCKDCNTKLTAGKVLPKTDHTWNSGKVTQNATCTTKGIKTFTCTVCESTRIEEIPATGHVNKIKKFAKKASCKSEGYTGDVYCRDCGNILEEGQVIPKTEHAWNDGEITTPATCTTKGIKTYTCTSCGTTKTEAIEAPGHGKTVIRNKKAASTTSEGYTGDTYCTICNQKISSGNTIAKLTPQTATPGKTIKDTSTNGVYKVLKDGVSVEFTKPVYKKVSVRIPDTIKVNGITCKVTGISANAFKNNKSLKSVTIGRNVTVIGTNAFYGCKKLSKVSGGNGIVKIDHRAFANCSSLSKITIPGSVTSIGKQAFCNCKKLRSITIKTSTLSGKTVGSKAFAGTYKKPTVKVPASQLKTYKKLLKARGMSSKAAYRK